MTEVFVGAGAAAGAGALYWWWHVRRLHAVARARLGDDLDQREAAHVVEVLPSLRRRMWIPWTAGVAAAAVLYFAVGLWVTYSVAIGVIVGTIAFLIEQHVAARNALKVETQLANAIDLMVGALGAGAGFTEAIESAVSESPQPLKAELNEVLGRIRYGEAPKQVWEDFSTRIPLETFRLFCFTLAVHGEVGGSLSPTLSSVGKSIRDRIEISRRIRAQSTEAQGSVIGIVCITYFLGLMMWRTNPQSFEEFLRNPIGANMVAAALVLQAIGLVWITKLAQLRF